MPRLRQPHTDYAAITRLLLGYGASGLSVSKALGCAPATARKKMNAPKNFTLGELDTLSRKYGIPFEEVKGAIVK